MFADDLAAKGDLPALETATELVSYSELDRRVAEATDRLGPTRRLVGIEAAAAVECVIGYLAALRGQHPILLLPPGGEGSSGRLQEVYDPDVLVCAETGWRPRESRSGTAHELHPDLALLLATSGSTGSEKVVRLSSASVHANAVAIGTYLGLRPGDRAITSLPLHYCYGLSVLNSHLAAGASVVLSDLSVIEARFWDLFASKGATGLAGVPHTFDLLDRIGFESMAVPTLRYVTQAGGRLSPERVRRYARLGERDGWKLYVMYGQTEATARMAYLPPHLAAARPEAIGVAIPGGAFEVDPVGDDPCHGELIYRGPNVMLGYATGPADLATGRVVDELRTGDLARRAPDGLIEITGRRSRFVKPFGVRVHLDHLEAVLDDAGVTAVCAGDDESLSVAVTNDADQRRASRLIATATQLPEHRVSVFVLAELPRLANGKPDHAAVHAAAPDPRRAPPPAQDASVDGNVLAAFADVLGRPVSADETFVSAGGDSLSYVELSVRIEELTGRLPPDWHLKPISELGSVPPIRRRRLRHLETTVALRAAAIVLIVGTHAKAWHVLGGAHVLLGVAGYNFARFRLAAGGAWRSAVRIAVPSMCWIAAVAVASDEFSWTHAVLAISVIGGADANWAYWFVEALVQILVATGVVLAIPPVRRAELSRPFAFAVGIVAFALAVRFGVIDLGDHDHRIGRAHEVAWLFALGWAAALADSPRRRTLVSALVVIAIPGFFDNVQRDTLVAAGLLAAVWVPSVPLVAPFHRVAGSLASASLWIYLSHWQVYPPVARAAGPLVALGASLLAGIAARRIYGELDRLARALATRLRRRRQASGVVGELDVLDEARGARPAAAAGGKPLACCPGRGARVAESASLLTGVSPILQESPRFAESDR